MDIWDISNRQGIIELSADIDSTNTPYAPNLKARFDNIENKLQSGISTLYFDWEIGTLSSVTGGLNAVSTTRIRTVGYHSLPFNPLRIVVPAGYRIILFAYNYDSISETYTYVTNIGWLIEGEHVIDGSLYSAYRFSISEVTERTVTDTSYADAISFEANYEIARSLTLLTLDYNFDMFCADAKGYLSTNVVENDTYGRKIVTMSYATYRFPYKRSFKVRQGQEISVEAYAKVGSFDPNVDAFCGVYCVYYDKNGGTIYSNATNFYKPVFTSSDRYAYHKFLFPVPRGVETAQIVLFVNNNSVSFTDFSVRSLSNLQKPARWSGLNYTAQGGLLYYAPNNTLDSVEFVSQCGISEMVINTWQTADGTIVSMHDRDVSTTYNGVGNIDTLTYAQTQELTSIFPLYYDTKLPKLEQMLAACARCGIHPTIRLGDLFSEVDDTDGNYAQIYAMVLKYLGIGNATIKSFEVEKLDVAYSVMGTDVKYIYTHAGSAVSEAIIAGLATKYGVKNFALDIEPNFVTKETIELAHSYGVPTSTYNVNNIQTAYTFARMGVDNICTTVLLPPIFAY